MDPGHPPLHHLADFLERHLADTISGVHLLPFYPYSSDDGFSVIDYRQVDPSLGSWEQIERIHQNFRLMFDAVVNHISRQSAWFQGFVHRQAAYKDYFIEVDPDTDLSLVVRPRALPLLTEVVTTDGPRHVWTTFSEDQIDLNFSNPRVLYEMIDLLLYYIERGAEIIRLDAIAYLWKEIGTPSIHLPQTHHVVKLFRAILDEVAPGVILITETNVPHAENISYFGDWLPGKDRTDEAQLVYQFPLAPLVLHSFHAGDATVLSQWAADLPAPSPGKAFFNFIASHDGIGLRPAEGLLMPDQVESLVQRTLDHGGRVSRKTNPDGSQSPYELNISLYDALNDPRNPDPELDTRRFIASQAIMLSLAGVPGIYVHSLLGSRNCQPCLDETQRARSINREKFRLSAIEAELDRPDSRVARVFQRYTELLKARRRLTALDPAGGQRVLRLDKRLFSLLRTDLGGENPVLCLINVSSEDVHCELGREDLISPETLGWRDILTGERVGWVDGRLVFDLQSYQYSWYLAEGGP
jgi:sucrose phosphorylase